MTTFRLQKSPGSNHAVTKFDVIDAASSIRGRITVPSEAAADLEKHWLGGAAQRPKAAAALATSVRGKQNPMVGAMVAAAKKHPLNRTAILRGC
jgi:hypothetical protein